MNSSLDISRGLSHSQESFGYLIQMYCNLKIADKAMALFNILEKDEAKISMSRVRSYFPFCHSCLIEQAMWCTSS